MHTVFLDDYAELGAEGGGTLQLEAGDYQLNETTVFTAYGNVSIQGAGMGKTILSLPPSPIGTFATDNGSLVGVFNTSLNGPSNGVTANFIQLSGPSPIDNFAMCDLTIDAQANNASEDWSGSLIFDGSGGVNHVFSDISEAGFYGPSGTPNGLHLDGYGDPAIGYVVDDLHAINDSWPVGPRTFVYAGPNFMNTGDVANCREENITGIGNFAFEVAPSPGCLVENVNVTGDITIDPTRDASNVGYDVPGGSWGGTLFQNVTVNVGSLSQHYAMSIDVSNGTTGGRSDFSDLRWNDDHFVGGVLDGNNMIDVTNSTVCAGINGLPATFEDNVVTWIPSSWGRSAINMPIVAYGGVYTAPGTTSVVTGDTFIFPNATKSSELLQLDVPTAIWTGDTFEVAGGGTNYVMSAPGISLTAASTITHLTYDSLGGGAPTNLSLLNVGNSPGFTDLGATVGNLTLITDNFPAVDDSLPAPTDLAASDLAAIGIVVVLVAVIAIVCVVRGRKPRAPNNPAECPPRPPIQ